MKNLYFFLLVVCLISISCTETNTRYPRVIKPILIGQGKLYGNGQEGITEQNLAIRTQVEWNNLLNAMNSVNNVSDSFAETEIDFNSYMVIAVFDEIRGNSGCSINISNIIEYIDKIVVDVHIVTTTSGADVINQPYCILKIPVIYNNIVFDSNISNDTVPSDTIDISLINTKWKLLGIVDTQTSVLTELEPNNCAECYSFTFDTDSTAVGWSTSNILMVQLRPILRVFLATYALGTDFYLEDAILFCNVINTITSYELNGNELNFYYNENKNYLKFIKIGGLN